MLWCEHLCGSSININLNIVKMMKNPTLFSYAVLLSIVCSTSCGLIPEPKHGVEELVEASTPLEVAGKSGKVEIDEKTVDLDHTLPETRIERSSKATLDKKDINVESKTDPAAESTLITAVKHDDKSGEVAKVDDKMGDVNDAAEEMSSERSITGLKDVGYENDNVIRTINEGTKEINEKSVDDQKYISRETTRSMPYDTHEILDNKARTAENSEENLEIQAKSDLEDVNAEHFGSRRSYSGSSGSAGFVISGRSGQIFDDVPLSMPNPNPAMLNVINQELMQPNDYFKSPLTSSNEYKSQNGQDRYIDPFSSAEYRPLEQFNSNPFANSYPYALQPTTTPKPTDVNRYQDGRLLNIVQPLDNLNTPIVRFLGQNFKPLPPTPFKPYEQNLPYPIFRPFNIRFNPLPTQPPRYYKKCNYCS